MQINFPLEKKISDDLNSFFKKIIHHIIKFYILFCSFWTYCNATEILHLFLRQLSLFKLLQQRRVKGFLKQISLKFSAKSQKASHDKVSRRSRNITVRRTRTNHRFYFVVF